MAKYYVDKVNGTFGVLEDLVIVNCKDHNDTNKFLTIAARSTWDKFKEWAVNHGLPITYLDIDIPDIDFPKLSD